MFCASPDVPQIFREMVAPTDAPHEEDIIALVKRYASNTTLSQLPLVVCPHNRPGTMPAAVPTELIPRRLRKNHYREQWRKLADRYEQLHSHHVHKSRGVRYLRDLSDQLRSQEAASPAPWHAAAGGVVRVADNVFNEGVQVALGVKPLKATWRPLPQA